MGVLSQSRDQGAASVVPTAQGPIDKTGFFENVGAGFRESVAGPHSTRIGEAVYEKRAYDQIVQALSQEGEQGADTISVLQGQHTAAPRPFRNPYVSPISLTHDPEPFAQYTGGDSVEKRAIWASVLKVRQRKPDFLKQFPDEASLSAWADKQRQSDLATAQKVTSRAGTLGTIGQFIGGMAGSVASMDPENVVGGVGAGAAGKTFARTILKRSVEGAGANAAAALVASPAQAVDAQHLGQEMTTADVERQVLQSAAIGAFIPHILHVPEMAGSAARTVVDKAATIPPVRDALVARSIAAGTIQDHSLLTQWSRTHNPQGIVDTSSPDERAAANVVLRDAATKEASPLHSEAVGQNDHRLDAIAHSLGVNLTTPDVPTTAPLQTPTVRDRAVGGRKPATFVEGINSAEGSTRNPRSSADGYGNFIESTWLSVAPHITDTTGMSREQILTLRHDKGVAAKATEYYAAQNGSYLRARGLEDSPGNLSLAHFLGPEGASALLKADPRTPVESLLPSKVIEANHEVLRGKSASEVVAWAHKRIGAAVDQPVARADAIPEADLLDAADYSAVPYERLMLKPDEVQTDAALMQYKSGGDEQGITGKLRDVTAWDPIMSSEILAWEGLDGRRVVVDGHQRVGLARRLAGEGQDVNLPTLVVREADGISAAQARVLGALRNINLGTGSLEDNARVLRDAPQAAELLKGAENRREIEGLANLDYHAFGAVLNDVIDPRIAAQIGLHAPRGTHSAMVDLLTKEHARSPAEAASMVRQAVADGFGQRTESQLSLLGDQPQQSLYAPIARILAAAQKKLREEKRTFNVLSEKAGTIEAAGNVLDRTANASKVISNDEALAILERTAHSAGPVRDALIASARAELSGTRRADAVNQFLDALSGIDLRSAAAGASEHGAFGEPSGEARGGNAAETEDSELPASIGSLFDHAITARDRAEPFSDPVGEGAKAQTEILNHDLLMDAKEPPPPLFDVPETGYRLSDEGDAKPLHEIMREAEDDELAAQALKDCLKGGGE
jgi:hypothetical protein